MSSWQCPDCRTVYADGIPACPNHEEASVAKVGAAGATQYVAEGAPIPRDLPPDVTLVGPGAPAAEEAEPDPVPATAGTRRPKVSRTRSAAAGG